MSPEQLEQRCRLLRTFFTIWAGLTFLCGSIPIIHVLIGIIMTVDPGMMGGGGQPPPRWFGVLFAGVGIFTVLLSYAFAAVAYYAGKFLGEQRRHTFCLVVACILCINIPLGTILGVFTILALNEPIAKEIFAANDGALSG